MQSDLDLHCPQKLLMTATLWKELMLKSFGDQYVFMSFQLNIRYLNPLFLAYDDRLREREETIHKCQVRFFVE